KELHLQKDGVYSTYEEMPEKEMLLPKGERIDFVCIITPNHLHIDSTIKALRKGVHVVLDKPITLNLPEAMKLYAVIQETNLLFCLTHTYTGSPMVKEARSLISSGILGKIRKIYVEYHQGWLWKKLEENYNKQAEWRTDPSKSGITGSMGDIG